MKTSIVVPSLNQCKYLTSCLDSILDQHGENVEILLYDGGSTDGSVDVIERYAKKLDYWQARPDGGQAAALKEGFSRATGDIFGWLNSDDILMPGALAKVRAYFKRHSDVQVVFGDAVWIDGEGKVIKAKREIDFDWDIFTYVYNYLPQPSTFFRQSAYFQVGEIDPTLRGTMDYDLWHKFAQRGSIEHIPSFLSGIRDHPDTKTNRIFDIFMEEYRVLQARYAQPEKAASRAVHLWQKFRRISKRLLKGSYRSLSNAEKESLRLSE
jgi:glycosyltransferase involved in cell wall biosynthesis